MSVEVVRRPTRLSVINLDHCDWTRRRRDVNPGCDSHPSRPVRADQKMRYVLSSGARAGQKYACGLGSVVAASLKQRVCRRDVECECRCRMLQRQGLRARDSGWRPSWQMAPAATPPTCHFCCRRGSFSVGISVTLSSLNNSTDRRLCCLQHQSATTIALLAVDFDGPSVGTCWVAKLHRCISPAGSHGRPAMVATFKLGVASLEAR